MAHSGSWALIISLCVGLAILLIYSDWYGNVALQKDISDLFKMTIGAFVGAWANQISK